MALLDLLGRRWQLRIIWELRDGALGFRDLQKRCDGMSPSVLSQRLAELNEAGIVGQPGTQEYELTELGQKLRMALAPLHQWSDEWASHMEPGGGGPAAMHGAVSRGGE
jgi:DNA-binding HxlR family transcriptional regulator